jgi:hypothetical protein
VGIQDPQARRARTNRKTTAFGNTLGRLLSEETTLLTRSSPRVFQGFFNGLVQGPLTVRQFSACFRVFRVIRGHAVDRNALALPPFLTNAAALPLFLKQLSSQTLPCHLSLVVSTGAYVPLRHHPRPTT